VTKESASAPTTRFVDPLRPVRTFEMAVDEILLGIEQARLRSGEALPTETQLAEQLSISKPTLRQALRVLERSGVIEVRRGKERGIYLATDFLPSDAIADNVVVEEDAAVRVLRARRAVETAVNLEALYTATEDDFAEIERTVELLSRPGIGAEEIVRADTMFHRAVARATHNLVLEETLRLVHRRQSAIRDEQLEGRAMDVHALHTNQLAALRSRDPAQLLAALDVHLHYLEDLVAGNLGRPWEELFAPEAAWVKTPPAAAAS
jgi:GntR family transcriptional repressor for pyruvate dehydrogenase complex